MGQFLLQYPEAVMALQLWTGGDREDVDHFIDLIVDLINVLGEAITSQDLRASLGTPSSIEEATKQKLRNL